MLLAILFLSFAALLVIGTPIAVCLGCSSLITMLVQGAGKPLDAVMAALPRIVSASSSKFVLLAIPFFILGGNIMEKAGISRKLINLAEDCVGHIKGGVAIVCILVSCFFAAISGSGPATVAALGLIMIPAMIKAGYQPAFAASLMATGGIGRVRIGCRHVYLQDSQAQGIILHPGGFGLCYCNGNVYHRFGEPFCLHPNEGPHRRHYQHLPY